MLAKEGTIATSETPTTAGSSNSRDASNVGNTSSRRGVNSCRKAATTEALARDVNSNENISTNKIDSDTRDNWNIMGRQQQHAGTSEPAETTVAERMWVTVGAPATGGMPATAETPKQLGLKQRRRQP
jgi:hypothetical protein